MGSATAWELTAAGKKVLLLEQQDSVYSFGSSFGEARISRSLGARYDIFSWLQQTSVAETKALNDYLNKHSGETHSMEDIYRTSPVTYLYDTSQQREVDNILYRQADTTKYAPDPAAARQLFGMKIPDTALVIREYKQYSGTMNPSALIAKMHQAILLGGNRVKYRQQVTGLRKVDDIYEVAIMDLTKGKEQTLRARNIVAAAGPYNGELTRNVAPYVASLITPKRLFLSFMQIREPVYHSLTAEEQQRLSESFPAAVLDAEIFYTMIEKFQEDGRPLLKVGGHMLRTAIEDLDNVWQKELTTEEKQWGHRRLTAYLQMLDLPVTAEDLEFDHGYSCVYSLTDSEIPYVTCVVNESGITDDNLVLIGGMSGVGAKGSLAYGLIAANLLLKRKNDSPMYQRAERALGIARLKKDISALSRE